MSDREENSVNTPSELERKLEKSREESWRSFGKKIRFYVPGFTRYKNAYFHSSDTMFPSISITGNACALKCEHCGGKVLETMISATTPERLFEVCRDLKDRGCNGCLISGGCLSDGSVPIERFSEALARVKKELGLTLAVHTGIIEAEKAKMLKDAGVDVALIDVIGSEDTIRQVYRLSVKVEDYENSLKSLDDSGIPYVPHVTVGLHYGALRGERHALEMIAKYRPSALVIIALIPLRGTGMRAVSPPSPEEIAETLIEARALMPKIPIVLGCMRPTGKHRVTTDILAVKAGVNAVAFPEEKAIDFAKSIGLELEFAQKCCSQIYEDARQGNFKPRQMP